MKFLLKIINSFSFNFCVNLNSLIEFRNLYSFDKAISKNKSVAIEVYISSTLFSLGLTTTWQGSDHAGPGIEITLFFLTVSLSLYDHRHWDYINQHWQRNEE